MKADAVAFSFAGDKYLGRPYSEMDCQAFVEKCMKDVGIGENLPGSNAWYRTMTWTGTPEDCVRLFGEVPRGALLYILKQDGKEPEKYRHDGIGNASHIGICTRRNDGAIHSSSSKGCVCRSKFQQKSISGGWNRVGLWDRFDYGKTVNWHLEHSGIGGTPPENKTGKEGTPMQGTVTAPTGGTVNLRKTKGGDLLERIQVGRTVTVTEYGTEWCRVTVGNLTGWMKTEFIRMDGDITPGEDEHIAPEPVEEEPELTGKITLTLDAAAWAAAYPALKALCNEIEQKVGRG